MPQLDPTVKKETLYIACWVAILSVLMQAVFLVIGKWDYTVLLGTLWGGAAAIANFLLMGLTVQKAVLKDEKDAKNLIRTSQTLRMFGQVAIAVIGAAIPIFNIIAVVIPLLFPRIAVSLRPLFTKAS